MTWWRHDPSLWSRSLVNRYAQRILRDNEAALRTRGHPRTPPRPAQHEEHADNDGCPEGMSNSEWRQLQLYKRWRKQLQEDPYKTLFGASEDMLSGKGLKEWDWVYKSFPKWMLNDIDINQGTDSIKTTKRDGQARDYGNRSTINQEPVVKTHDLKNTFVNSSAETPRRRKSHFPEPCIRTTNFERDDFGIVSPSDLRRPRESSNVRIVDNVVDHINPLKLETSGVEDSSSGTPLRESTSIASPHRKKESTPAPSSIVNDSQRSFQPLREDAAARESVFIDEFLAIKSQQSGLIPKNSENEKSWRQTALQRRTSSVGSESTKAVPVSEARPDQEMDEAWRTVPKNFATPPSDAAYKVSLLPEKTIDADQALEHDSIDSNKYALSTKTALRSAGRSIQYKVEVTKEKDGELGSSPISSSTSEKLNMLPNDDVDFLNAAEIRASMAGKRASIKGDIDKLAKHKALEKEFLNIYKNHQDIDPMIESKTINDRLVRRTERKLRQLQENSNVLREEPERDPISSTTSEPYQSESSIDRMKRWLEEGSATLSKHFWQDPIPEGASELAASKAYLDKIIARIQKGRSATLHIAEDLERDIPSCKQLLKRLKDDEEMLDHSTSALRRRMMEASTQASTPLKLKQTQTHGWKYEKTELELQVAIKSLSESEKTGETTNVGELFRRRLRLAGSVCHKNAKLTRSLIWSLQGRLEDNKIPSHVQAYYRVIAHRLLTLRDTQIALVQLMDRAMQLYNVAPKTLEEDVGSLTISEVFRDEEASVNPLNVQSSNLARSTASDAHLANEVQAQKSAMQGLSDDGYFQTPTISPKKMLDEPSPLAHSLFRPFALQLESLGKETDIDPEVERLKEEAKRKLSESKLVDEIVKAYEDVYGPITADHSQGHDEVRMQNDQNKKMTAFQLLKDNPAKTVTEHVAEPSCSSPDPGSSFEGTLQGREPEIQTSSRLQGDVASSAFDTSPNSTNAVEASLVAPSSDTASPEVSTETSNPDVESAGLSLNHLPTHYTILILNAKTDTFTITKSTTPPPRDPSPVIPIHLALSTLDSPAKFIPHLTSEFEVVTAKRDMLVLRDCVADKTTISTTSTSVNTETEGRRTGRNGMNPIDGTTRLSPTGYVGVEDTEQLEKEFQERRLAAGKMAREQREERRSKKRGVGGVLRTAIWAAAGCYVIGVLGEVFK